MSGLGGHRSSWQLYELFLGVGGNRLPVSLARVFHGSPDKSPGAPQAAEKGTGVGRERDADAARPLCATMLQLRNPSKDPLCRRPTSASRLQPWGWWRRGISKAAGGLFLIRCSEMFRVCWVLFWGAEVEGHSSLLWVDYKLGLEKVPVSSV